MARGVLGDDGPSLWMFLAVVLVWSKIAGFWNRTTSKFEDVFETGKNSGGPMQSETTDEISMMQREVNAWHVSWSKCRKKRVHYENIALKLWKEGWGDNSAVGNVDEDVMLDLCRPLNADELRAVAVVFGVKDKNNKLGLSIFTGHIFHFFEDKLTDSFMGGNDLSEMRKIWAKAGIWP